MIRWALADDKEVAGKQTADIIRMLIVGKKGGDDQDTWELVDRTRANAWSIKPAQA